MIAGSLEVLIFWGIWQWPCLGIPTSFQDRKGNTLSAMWKPTQTGSNNPNPTPEPSRPATPAPTFETAPGRAPASAPASGEQATIGKGLFIKGEINGSESLYIDGKVEGSINLPGNRVTVGRNGQVSGVFPVLAASSGGAPFVFFSAMMVVQFFVVLLWYPETKGVTLEGMQKKLGIA